MSIYTTPDFWRGAAERAIKTFAQALLGVLTGGASGLLDVDWVAALSVAALATVVSLLTSLATPDFTAGAPADDGYQGKHEAPDPRHHVAD
ncbi:holin [Micrococcus luteus]|uniref:holin n=1 Tax=Micrococcus luteus TaxID=1270 RepID=UPI002304491C|nr:holin [Micrococcus luteus]